MKHYTNLKKKELYHKRRLCSRCSKSFVATGKYSRVCPDCNLSGEHWIKKRQEKLINNQKNTKNKIKARDKL